MWTFSIQTLYENQEYLLTSVVLFNKKKYYLRKIFRPIFLYVLFIRSFFLTDKSQHILLTSLPLISMLFVSLNKYSLSFSNFSNFYLFILMGIYLIAYDNIGSQISFNIINDYDPIISISYLISLKKNKLMLKRFLGGLTWSGVVIGTTKMTQTGRATLIAGFCTGTVWLFNSYLDRKSATQDRQAANERAHQDREAANERARQDREAAAYQAERLRTEAARERAFKAWQQQHKTWAETPIYRRRGPEPQFTPTNN